MGNSIVLRASSIMSSYVWGALEGATGLDLNGDGKGGKTLKQIGKDMAYGVAERITGVDLNNDGRGGKRVQDIVEDKIGFDLDGNGKVGKRKRSVPNIASSDDAPVAMRTRAKVAKPSLTVSNAIAAKK